jgi:hypothetical protein
MLILWAAVPELGEVDGGWYLEAEGREKDL